MSPTSFQIPPPCPDAAEAVGKWMRVRLGFLYVCLAAFFLFVAFRLVQLQVLVNPVLAALAQKQFQKVGKVAPYRQPIYDRNREELAVSIPASSVFARPKLIRSKRKVARALSKILGGAPSRWMARLDTRKSFVWIHRQLGAETAKRLAKLNLAGVFIESENKRIYPNGPLASQVLGFTDIDGNGLSGLELSLNKELLEKETRFPLPRDGKGNPSYIDTKYISAEEAKGGVYVTLDRRLQHAVEEELQRAMDETGARAAYAVVMDPFNGEIFALGQQPGFDPNFASQTPSAAFTNRLLSHLYEPGSIMKPIFAAEAIQDGIMTPETLVDCGQGKLVIGRDTIHEAEARDQFGIIPLEQVIRFSSNVGAVKVAQALGAKRLQGALDRFGLTARTGISLPGETTLQSKAAGFWKVPIQLATAGFGQGISVTPLQIVAAYAPFANGGYLVRPKILLRETLQGGNARMEAKRILTSKTIQAMRRILLSVTEEKGGTGVGVRLPGIRVAGKTGTAQKYEQGIGYGGGKYFSSFIGFLPAEQPELLVGVMVDEPKGKFFSAETAVPLFRRISERSLQILDKVPKQRILAAADGKKALLPLSPATLTAAVASETAPMVDVSEGKWIMPDLKGVSVREALRSIGRYLGNVKVSGSGYLDSQAPKPGSVVGTESAVALHFSPTG